MASQRVSQLLCIGQQSLVSQIYINIVFNSNSFIFCVWSSDAELLLIEAVCSYRLCRGGDLTGFYSVGGPLIQDRQID